MARALNRQIVEENLPPNVRDIVARVSSNVDAAVDAMVKDLKRACEERVAQFEAGRYPAELQQALDKSVAEFSSDFARVGEAVGGIRAKAIELETHAKNAGDSGRLLVQAAKDLADRAEALDKTLNDFRTKVTKLGENTGKLIGAAALKAVTGGIA